MERMWYSLGFMDGMFLTNSFTPSLHKYLLSFYYVKVWRYVIEQSRFPTPQRSFYPYIVY